jgi:hypothetical protein
VQVPPNAPFVGCVTPLTSHCAARDASQSVCITQRAKSSRRRWPPVEARVRAVWSLTVRTADAAQQDRSDQPHPAHVRCRGAAPCCYAALRARTLSARQPPMRRGPQPAVVQGYSLLPHLLAAAGPGARGTGRLGGTQSTDRLPAWRGAGRALPVSPPLGGIVRRTTDAG